MSVKDSVKIFLINKLGADNLIIFFLYHQIIDLEKGGVGKLTLPGDFGARPFCEWWLRVSGSTSVLFAISVNS
jgi:hypothetical protein